MRMEGCWWWWGLLWRKHGSLCVLGLQRASVGGEYSFCLLALCLHMSTRPSLLHKTLPRRHVQAWADTSLRPRSQKSTLFAENLSLAQQTAAFSGYRWRCLVIETESLSSVRLPPRILNATVFTVSPTADLITVVFASSVGASETSPRVLHQRLLQCQNKTCPKRFCPTSVIRAPRVADVDLAGCQDKNTFVSIVKSELQI